MPAPALDDECRTTQLRRACFRSLALLPFSTQVWARPRKQEPSLQTPHESLVYAKNRVSGFRCHQAKVERVEARRAPGGADQQCGGSDPAARTSLGTGSVATVVGGPVVAVFSGFQADRIRSTAGSLALHRVRTDTGIAIWVRPAQLMLSGTAPGHRVPVSPVWPSPDRRSAGTGRLP
jgi:hypothetical protein